MKHLIVITGPTAVGKTLLTLMLAERYQTPVIGADSRQMFRQMSIGTAAPTAEEQLRVKHHFVQCLNIDEYYSASMYEADALKVISDIHRTQDVALMSGGSMMYIDAVCNGIDDIPTVNDDIRQEVKRMYAEEGMESLLAELRQRDPQHYDEVDRQNPRRVMHAVEICLQTGLPYSSFRKGEKKSRPFNIIKIGLNRPREELYQRINVRVDQMMRGGLLEEARALYPQRGLNALNTVGYKELFAYMDGRWPLDEAVERIKGNTRRYARKQLTWFKRDASVEWFHPDDQESIIQYINNHLS